MIAVPGPIGCTGRRLRQWSPKSSVSAATAPHWPGDRSRTRISAATVSRILRRLGLNRLAAPVRRYEREHPGEHIHIDIKELGRFNRVGHRITAGQSNSRGVGWEYVHVCIDDASRIAYAEIKKSERKGSAVAFLKRRWSTTPNSASAFSAP